MTDKILILKKKIEDTTEIRNKYVNQFNDTETNLKNLQSSRENILLSIQKLNGNLESFNDALTLFDDGIETLQVIEGSGG